MRDKAWGPGAGEEAREQWGAPGERGERKGDGWGRHKRGRDTMQSSALGEDKEVEDSK